MIMPALRQFVRLCSTKPKKDAKTVKAVKRQNWENLQLFGPVLRPLTLQKESNPNVNERKVNKSTVKENTVKISPISTFPLSNVWRSLDPKSEYPNTVLDLNINAKVNNQYPSISAILSKTMPPESQQALERWKKLMIEKLGEEGFNLHQKQVLDQGKSLHASVEKVLKGSPYDSVEVSPSNWGHWRSLEAVFPRISNAAVLENWVMHPYLHYKGIIDCVAMYRNEVVLIEWKTSSKIKSKIEYTYDNPIQVAAYMGALNYDPNYKFQLNKGVLVVAYENGSPAQIFVMKEEMCLEYWQKWLTRLQLFNSVTNSEINVKNSVTSSPTAH